MSTIEFKEDEIKSKLKKFLIRKEINASDLKLLTIEKNYVLYDYKDTIIEIIYVDDCRFSSISEYVKNSNYILKPLDETLIKMDSINLRVLCLPKLYSDDITNDDEIDIYCKLRDDGYLWEDVRKENLVRDKDGHVLLANYNKLTYINNVPINIYQFYIDEHARNNPDLNKIYMKRKKLKDHQKNKDKLLSKIKFWNK